MNKMEQPTIYKIEKIVDEARDFKTFIFKGNLYAKPGQFIMVWLPGIDEKPFSISFQDDSRFGITVYELGNFTKRLFKLNTGDKIGIRGPYGSSFNLKGKNVVLVGGGCGSAPLGFLADELKKKGINLNFITGAKCKDSILFYDRMNSSGINTMPATDDGSFGFKGFTTQLLEEFLHKNKIDKVYSCGPEKMMKAVVMICDKYYIPCEVSLERYMKCAIGLCGQCCIDHTGERICVEGPVFSGEKVKKFSEFGEYKRDKSGKKVEI